MKSRTSGRKWLYWRSSYRMINYLGISINIRISLSLSISISNSNIRTRIIYRITSWRIVYRECSHQLHSTRLSQSTKEPSSLNLLRRKYMDWSTSLLLVGSTTGLTQESFPRGPTSIRKYLPTLTKPSR